MTYTIGISGSKTTTSPEESKEFEEKIVEQTREFVSTLEGVHLASVTGNQIGTVNVQEGGQ